MSLISCLISLESQRISLLNRRMCLICRRTINFIKSLNQFSKSTDQFPPSLELFDKLLSFLIKTLCQCYNHMLFTFLLRLCISLTWRIALVSKTSQKQLQGWSLKLIFIKKETRTCAEACTTMASWTWV